MHLIPRLVLAFASLLPLAAGAVTVPADGIGTLSGVAVVDTANTRVLLSDIRQSTDIATIVAEGFTLGRVQTLPGVNRVEVGLPPIAPGDLAAVGLSLWMDTLAFTGETAGVAQASVHLHGTLTGPSAAVYVLAALPFDADIAFPELTSDDVARLVTLFDTAAAESVPGHILSAVRLGGEGTTVLDEVLTASVAYDAGTPVTIIGLLLGAAGPGGSFSAFDTASFGLAPPAGVGYTTLSGAQYPAAVPEPGTWALMVAGIAFVGWTVRRR